MFTVRIHLLSLLAFCLLLLASKFEGNMEIRMYVILRINILLHPNGVVRSCDIVRVV